MVCCVILEIPSLALLDFYSAPEYIKNMSRFSPLNWPVVRQIRGRDPFGRDRVVQSVCPYCAVGCSQRIYVKDDRVIQVEGDPDSPISRGRLCPKGSASEQLINSASRLTTIKYRAPYSTEWQELDEDTAMDMIADRYLEARRNGWQDTDDEGRRLNRTMGVAGLGGATLDNEENYLIKKLFTATGAIQVENQARI